MRRTLSLLLALLFSAGCLCAWASASGETVMWVSTKTGRNLNVRSAKVVSTDTKIGSLPNGTAISVLSMQDGWAEIVYQPAGASAPISPAYVQADLLSETPPAKYSSGTVSTLPEGLAYSSTTVSELNNQFAAMRRVDAYDVVIVPDTQTGTVRLSWGPSTNSTAAAFLPAGFQVSVLATNGTWLMVYDPNSGRIGYVPEKYTALP